MALNTLQNTLPVTTIYEPTKVSLINNTDLNSSKDFGSVLAQNLTSPTSPTSPTATTSVATSNLLTTAENSELHRPNIKQFMDATGLNSKDASDLVYGVIGSNTDTRNWQEIMASEDPVKASRVATNAMYNQTAPAPLQAAAVPPSNLKHSATLSKSGNFAITQKIDERYLLQAPELKLVASDGLILRDAGSSAEAISRNAWLFGFDTAPLTSLTTKAPLQLQKPMTQAAMESAYRPSVTDLNESIDSFFKSVGADAAKLLTQLDLD